MCFFFFFFFLAQVESMAAAAIEQGVSIIFVAAGLDGSQECSSPKGPIFILVFIFIFEFLSGRDNGLSGSHFFLLLLSTVLLVLCYYMRPSYGTSSPSRADIVCPSRRSARKLGHEKPAWMR